MSIILSFGRLLHAAKTKACLPNSDRGFGTTRFPADEERGRCLAATAVTGKHSSARCDGAMLCRALFIVKQFEFDALWYSKPVEVLYDI